MIYLQTKIFVCLNAKHSDYIPISLVYLCPRLIVNKFTEMHNVHALLDLPTEMNY